MLLKERAYICSCRDIEHILYASLWLNKDVKNIDNLEIELLAEQINYIAEDYTEGFFKRLWWRLKNSFKILFLGQTRFIYNFTFKSGKDVIDFANMLITFETIRNQFYNLHTEKEKEQFLKSIEEEYNKD